MGDINSFRNDDTKVKFQLLVHLRSLCTLYLNNDGLHGPIFVIFVPWRSLPWRSSHFVFSFCSESIGFLTKVSCTAIG